jgi:cytochrome c6
MASALTTASPASGVLAAARLLAAALVLAGAAAAHAGDTARGAELYRQHCASCHGAGGRPVLPNAPDFTRHTALLKPDLALLASIRRGRGAMPAYDGVLRDRDILDVVSHLRTLR